MPLHYLLGFSAVVITSVRDFLAASGRGPEDIARMQDAWTRPYTTESLW